MLALSPLHIVHNIIIAECYVLRLRRATNLDSFKGGLDNFIRERAINSYRFPGIQTASAAEAVCFSVLVAGEQKRGDNLFLCMN